MHMGILKKTHALINNQLHFWHLKVCTDTSTPQWKPFLKILLMPLKTEVVA